MKLKNYNVDWSKYFCLDANSPSGIVRASDIYFGTNHSRIMYRKGTVAGSAKICYRSNRAKSWTVRVAAVDYMVHRIVYVLAHGYIEDELVVDHLDGDPFNNAISNLVLKTVKQNSQNTRKRDSNTSGIQGVSLQQVFNGHLVHRYWTAQWRDTEGKACVKHFSIKKLGNDQAKSLAVAYRTEQISLLNAAGASYTERHIGLTPVEPPATPSVQPT